MKTPFQKSVEAYQTNIDAIEKLIIEEFKKHDYKFISGQAMILFEELQENLKRLQSLLREERAA